MPRIAAEVLVCTQPLPYQHWMAITPIRVSREQSNISLSDDNVHQHFITQYPCHVLADHYVVLLSVYPSIDPSLLPNLAPV